MRKARQRYSQAMKCQEGCSDCCHRDLSLFPFELSKLLQAVCDLPATKRQAIVQRARLANQQQGEAPCPLLEDDRCLVYSARSVICRTHGVVSVLRVDDKVEYSLCPYNFLNVDHVAGEHVLDLDPVNRTLATLNHIACQRLGVSPQRQRIGQAIVSEFGDSGDGE